jgi:predicted RND superfamily exporter protein
MEDLPLSIIDQYGNKTRDQFLITVYPAGSIYDGNFLNRFADDVERVSDKATGSGPLFKALLKIFGQDGRNAVILTIFVVFLLLWIDFQNPKHALMAIIPLALGVFWMVGMMHLGGMKLSMMSVMGLPLIIGIGIDDGVHIMHRWRHEGRGKIRVVFSSTGKAIFLTSLTTMFAFGSLVFSAFPAFGQFGGALFIGVAACFLTTTIILPGILGLIERNSKSTITQ